MVVADVDTVDEVDVVDKGELALRKLLPTDVSLLVFVIPLLLVDAKWKKLLLKRASLFKNEIIIYILPAVIVFADDVDIVTTAPPTAAEDDEGVVVKFNESSLCHLALLCKAVFIWVHNSFLQDLDLNI